MIYTYMPNWWLRQLMREGMAYVDMSFVSRGCPVSDVGNIHLVWNDTWDAFSAFIRLPRMSLSTDLLVQKRTGLVVMPPLPPSPRIRFTYETQGINSRSASGFATDSPFIVWGRRWTHLYRGPLLGFKFLNDSCCVNFICQRGIYYWYFAFILALHYTSKQVSSTIFPFKWFYCEIVLH